jgi:Phage integrase family
MPRSQHNLTYRSSKPENGRPLNLDNIVRRVVVPALSPCAVCKKQEVEHKLEGHAFRRGLATNLHTLGIADKDMQAILGHSNIGLTQNVCFESVSESQVSALDSMSEKFEVCNDLVTTAPRTIQ